jgi:FkbM family methyltransferase
VSMDMSLMLRLKRSVPLKYRRLIMRLLSSSFEFIGSDVFSRPALNQIDRKLEKYLDYRDGFFVEAGANDGYSQSNTYYFERFRGWTGILIEGIPELYEECRKNRPNSLVFNYALVSSDYDGQYVTMMYADLMSLVKGAQKSDVADEEHIKKGMEIENVGTYRISVPARTLTSILDEVGVKEIDLVSLDVEGYEMSVLKGLDLNKYRPQYVLVEARFRQEIEDYLSGYRYEAIDELSGHDVLYREVM